MSLNPKIEFEIRDCWVDDIKKIYIWISECIKKCKSGKFELVFKRQYKKHSDQARGYYWAVVIEIAAKHFGMSAGQTHIAFKIKYLGYEKKGKYFFIRRYSTLSKEDQFEYVEKIRRELWEDEGVLIPEPEKISVENLEN